ncbi:MAG: hypothetical protein IPH18_05850 [Chitinophagaceae bacterium]|nr:hypothetical protein [Chitinophagaceae bacterium]
MYRLNLHTKNIIMLLFVVLVSLQVSYNQPGQTKQPATNSKTNQTAMASPNNEVTILKTVQPRFYVKQKEEQNISFTAYVQDPDLVNPTNIRQTPGGEVITELEKGSDYMVEIVGQKMAGSKSAGLMFLIIMPLMFPGNLDGCIILCWL